MGGVVQILGIGGMTKLVEVNGEFIREIKNVMRFGETKTLESNRIRQNLKVMILAKEVYHLEGWYVCMKRMIRMKKRRSVERSPAAIHRSSRRSRVRAIATGRER